MGADIKIELMLKESAAESVRELAVLLEEADRLCAAGELSRPPVEVTQLLD